MKKPVIIVDENDQEIGLKMREEIDSTIDIYRVTGIWLSNSKGEILLAQRKLTKLHDPGKWSIAAVGTVEEGDTYESNAYKELEEELGITGVSLSPHTKHYFSHPQKFFAQLYTGITDKLEEDFIIQEEEVEKVRWVTLEYLQKDLRENPDKYVPTLTSVLENFLS